MGPIEFATAEKFLMDWIASKEVTKARGTTVRYRFVVESFIKFLGNRASTNLGNIRPVDIAAFRDQQVKEGKSNGTASPNPRHQRSDIDGVPGQSNHRRPNRQKRQPRLLYISQGAGQTLPLLRPEPNEVMLIAQAYERFAGLAKQREMVPIKRSVFKELMKPLVRERFNAGLRNDLVVEGRYQQG